MGNNMPCKICWDWTIEVTVHDGIVRTLFDVCIFQS